MTLDIVLIYYDNPTMLDRLLTRMYFHTDYNKFKKYIKFYIADSGTPKENIDKSLKIVDKWKDKIDIVSLIFFTNIDFKKYYTLLPFFTPQTLPLPPALILRPPLFSLQRAPLVSFSQAQT